MANKTTFTPEEWKLLLESVVMSSMAVTAAEPSGLWGLLKEGFASSSALLKAKDNSDPLVKDIVADFMTSEGRGSAREGLREKFSGGQPAEMKSKAIETLRQASMLLDKKAPEDALAVKNWLRQISEDVAEAAKEGGFFSGVQVSEAEKATLAEISSALNLAVQSPSPQAGPASA